MSQTLKNNKTWPQGQLFDSHTIVHSENTGFFLWLHTINFWPSFSTFQQFTPIFDPFEVQFTVDLMSKLHWSLS